MGIRNLNYTEKIINSLGNKESCDWTLGNFLRGIKTKKTHLRVKCTSLGFMSSIFFLYLYLWYFIMAIDGTEAWKYPELLSSKVFPGGSGLKNLPAQCKRCGHNPCERSLEEGNGNPLLYSCLWNPMDRAVWQAAGSLKGQTQLEPLKS